MRRFIPIVLLLCFTISEIEVVVGFLLPETEYVIEYSETTPDAEGEKGNENIEDTLKKDDKSLSVHLFTITKTSIKLSFQNNQRFLLYCSPVQKIPVPPPEYS